MKALALAGLLLIITGCAVTSPLYHWQSMEPGAGESTNPWSFENGEWSVDGDVETYLVSGDTWQDLALEVEFFVEATVNSGVFIRCQDPRDITPFTCLEANIWDNHPQQQFRTGAIVARAFPPLEQVSTIGKWNRMVIVAKGDRVDVRVNGLLTATFQDPSPQTGYLALQHAGNGMVKFRNVSIRSL